MESPVKEFERLTELLARARRNLAEGKLEEARKTAMEALPLDELYVKTFELLAEVCAARGVPTEAETWRARARDARYQNWKREVEAETRGHHEVLGTPN